MKYYLIVGEASGDLHASHLMAEIAKRDAEAEFRFFGGDMMTAVGETMPEGRCTRVKHYKELAYMGFLPVLLHLRTIFSNMAMCKKDIMQWQPDTLILVDYPGFNLDIAKYIHAERKKTLNTRPPLTPPQGEDGPSGGFFPPPCGGVGGGLRIYYYIAPKIWAWKEYRIKNIKRDVDKLFSILPFEVQFFEQKHGYPINYVGNPTAQEVREFKASYTETKAEFCKRHGLDEGKDIIAVLPGSRKQELKSNLAKMLGALERGVTGTGSVDPELGQGDLSLRPEVAIAGAPGLEPEFYGQFVDTDRYKIIFGETYKLLSHAKAALVVSGTATLETALFKVPQVVVYETGWHWLFKTLRKYLLKVKWVSLVNLIANREVVPEQVADTCTIEQIAASFAPLLDEKSKERQAQLAGYDEVLQLLGEKNAPEETAKIIVGKGSQGQGPLTQNWVKATCPCDPK